MAKSRARVGVVLARYPLGLLLLLLLLGAVACFEEVRSPGIEVFPWDASAPPTLSAEPSPAAPVEAGASEGPELDDFGTGRPLLDAGTSVRDAASAPLDGTSPQRDAATFDAQSAPADAGHFVDAGDFGTAIGDAHAACNDLRPNMFTVALSASPLPPPDRQQGGMTWDGTYRLEEAVVYDSNRASGVPDMRVETLKISGDVWQHVAYWDGEPTARFTHRASLYEAIFTLGLTCGTEFDARVFSGLGNLTGGLYTALPQMLTLQVRGDGEAPRVYVLKYLRLQE
jgi:hypothetical protein